jgi:FAD:protein FMN transferase
VALLSSPVSRTEFPALGGIAVVLTTDPAAADAAVEAVRNQVAAIDAACSRFRPDSELTRVNTAAGRFVQVGPLFAQALTATLRVATLPDGDVDPTCGASLSTLGYDRDFPAVAGGPAVRITGWLAAPGWRAVDWDPARQRVRIPAGTGLDFGATAKALAADLAARKAATAAGCGVLVSLSGDIAVCGPAAAGGWRVHVTDDHRSGDDAPGQTVTLAEGGLATSSTTVRTWKTRRSSGSGPTEVSVAHHILDPRTGRPADIRWRTVTVAAGTCLDANIAATAAIVRGTAAPRWLLAHRLPARLVCPDGSVMALGGWPTDPVDSTEPTAVMGPSGPTGRDARDPASGFPHRDPGDRRRP